jgi:CTP:molybdopterin cytidylyltransferase MocA
MVEPVVAMPFAGVVPCSGGSTRMGKHKGLLELEGKSFLRRTVNALANGGCEPVLVVVAEGEEGLAAEAAAAGAVVLLNPDPGDGPITSLRIALEALDDSVDGVAYLPVDHPMVRSGTVRRLLEAAHSAEAPLTIPLYQAKRGHPAVLGKKLFAELLDPSLEGGAKTVVYRHLPEALLIDVDDDGVMIDIDTPDAYEAVLTSGQSAVGGER